jgi:hypothetical protein
MRRFLLPLALFALVGCTSVGPEPSVATSQPLAISSHQSGAQVATQTVVISGTAPAGARIVRDISGAPDDDAVAARDGRWKLEVELDQGRNELTFRIGDDKATAITLDVTYIPEQARTASPNPTTPPMTSLSTGPTGPTEVATVVKVVDGDTIRVDIDGVEYPVRYIGIDAPEIDNPTSSRN